ncbi:MAG: flavin reductase family protein [Ruminococcaceae bacterium]|nr:flavin reductase family protein [Oscillospiraceae bacterium]
MSQFYEISPEQIEKNPFIMIDKEWMLIGAEKEGEVNAMTASWGGLGVLWNKKVSFCFIRPQRYTREFVDSADRFSLSFFEEKYRDTLGYFGRVSGRTENKIEKSGLTVSYAEGAPYFAEGNLILICRKIYVGTIEPEHILLPEIDKTIYSQQDYHKVYVGEIVKVLMKV